MSAVVTMSRIMRNPGYRDSTGVGFVLGNAHFDRFRDGPRQLVGPLDCHDTISPELIQPEIVDLARIVKAIKVHVEKRQPAATVFLDQRERRAADLVWRDAKALRESADECRLPSAQIADEQHD